jgi:HAD superfamily hydrolase (TIGR01509 family)
MKKAKCIIFDCDGVLVDSEVIGIRILTEMSKPYGLDMTLPDAVKLLRGLSLKAALDTIETLTGNSLPDDFETSYRQQTYAAFQLELQPVEGIIDFINTLHIPFCVASSGPVEKIRLNLSLVGLLEKFEGHIFSSFEIKSWKPDPGIFLHAAKTMGYTPEECIVIEDSPSGVMAATTGGFKVFGLANEETADELANAGAVVFHRFGALSKLLLAEGLLL